MFRCGTGRRRPRARGTWGRDGPACLRKAGAAPRKDGHITGRRDPRGPTFTATLSDGAHPGGIWGGAQAHQPQRRT